MTWRKRLLAFVAIVSGSLGIACGRVTPDAPTNDAPGSSGAQLDGGLKTSGPCGPPGTLDPLFGSGGLTTVEPERGDACVAVDSRGRIYVVGATIHRFTADGQPDPGWAPEPNAASGPCVVDAADRLVVASLCAGRLTCLAVSRFDGDGNADASFGTGGTVAVDVDSMLGVGALRVARVALAPSGDIVVAATGFQMILDATESTPVLARVSASGVVLGTGKGPAGGVVGGLAMDPLRGVVLAMSFGGTPARSYLAEFDFNLQARADFVPARPNDRLRDIVRLADGTLVVVDEDGKSFSRLDATGAASATSAPHQALGTFSGSGASGASSLLALGDGSFAFAGTVNSRIALVRVHTDDSIDATFGDAPNPAVVGGLVLTLGDMGPLGVNLRGAALDARGVVIAAQLNDTNVSAIARVCR